MSDDESCFPELAQQKGEKMPTFEEEPCATAVSVTNCAVQPATGSTSDTSTENVPTWRTIIVGLPIIRKLLAAENVELPSLKVSLIPDDVLWNNRKAAALQSVPSSQPPEVSHYEYRAGRGYLEPIMQPSDTGQSFDAERAAECILAICGGFVPGGWEHPGEKCLQLVTNEVSLVWINGRGDALEKLRELEAKWRNPEWARAHISDDRPSEFICADELHAVIAPAPHPIEKD